MIKWIQTSRLSIKNSLFSDPPHLLVSPTEALNKRAGFGAFLVARWAASPGRVGSCNVSGIATLVQGGGVQPSGCLSGLVVSLDSWS